MKLVRNAAECIECGETVISAHRHDFQTCKCGSLSVDGGLDYTRRAFKSGSGFRERCAYAYDPHFKSGEAAGKFIVWSPNGKTNPSIAFDFKGDAEWAAKELASRVKGSDWYVGQLSHVTAS